MFAAPEVRELCSTAHDAFKDVPGASFLLYSLFEAGASRPPVLSGKFCEMFLEVCAGFIPEYYNTELFPGDAAVLPLPHRYAYYLALANYEKENGTRLDYIKAHTAALKKCAELGYAKDLTKIAAEV
jgi:hypothetical protein